MLATNPDIVRAPDAWFVRAERVPAEGIPRDFRHGYPDLAVEVLSPSDRRADVMRTVREYLTAGTPLVWVIDPDGRWAEVFRADGTYTYLDENGALDGEDVLPGFALTLRDVFEA